MENKLINYEVSVWEDTYVAAAAATESTEGSTDAPEGTDGGDEYIDFNLTELHEVKLGIIGSTNSSFGGNIFEPQLTSNVNGTHTFTFSIHTEYFNPMTGTIEHNPYVDWLVNERKIKLRRDDKYDDSGERGKWYDFIIKNINEDSVNKKITYTCKDAHVCELSKDGFEIELSTEMNNNMGSAQDLAKYVMEGTDWDVPDAGEDGSATIIQYSQPNAMWDGTTEREIVESKVQKFNPVLGKTVTEYGTFVEVNEDNYVFSEETINNFEELKSKATRKDEKILLYRMKGNNQYCYYYNNREWTYSSFKEGEETPSLVQEWRDSLWGYSQKEFISARTVVNLIDNWKDFKNSYGFKAVDENSSVEQTLLHNETHELVSIDSLDEDFTSYLRMEGLVLCDVFGTKKEKMLEYWKSQTPLRFKYKAYNNKSIVFGFWEYSYENGNVIVGNDFYKWVYENGGYSLYPCIEMTEEEFKSKKLGFFIGLMGETDIQELELYPYILDDNNNEILPLYSLNTEDATKSIDSITREKYYLYDEELNNTKTSSEEYVYEYVGDSLPAGTKVYYTTEKQTSIEASKSNRFNILQTIAEKFECWVRFKIEHAADGSITSRKIIFVQELGTVEAPGFKYGLNLKGITRQIDSEQIVSKLIVQPNSNEFAEGGSCTITRADGNAVKENLMYNLQYFVDMGLLDGESVKSDLSNLHSKLAKINLNKLNLLKTLDKLYATILGYKNDIEAYSALYQEVNDNLIEARKRIAEMTGYEWSWWKSSQTERENTYIKEAEEEYQEKLNRRRYSANPASLLSVEEYFDLYYAVFFPDNPDYGNLVTKTEDDGKIKVYDYGNIFFCFDQKWEMFSEDPRNENTLSDFSIFFEGIPTSEREEYLVYQSGTTTPDYLATYYKYNVERPSASSDKVYARYEYYYNKHKQQIEGWVGLPSFDSLVVEIKTLEGIIETYELQLDTATNELAKNTAEHDKETEELNENSSTISSIIKAFEKKYARYIQEGTWISEDYTDDTKYFNDAKFVFAQSWQPKISYTINVVDIAAATLIPEIDYSMYTYNCGEKSTIEDTEFFGYEKDGRPKKVEIIIEELVEKFDTPDQNTIKVQNYTSYFDSLFHRVEAATQTVELNAGKYARAADIVNPEGYIDISMLQSAFDNGEWSLSQLSDQSVTWADGKGIKVSSPKDSDRQVRLANIGIFLTTDGGATWKTGITGDGIHADVITTGLLNTNNILIGNSKTPMFRWDKEGISAYKFKIDGELTSSYNPNVYVRLNQYGLYGIGNYDEEINDITLDEIWNNSSFYLGWRGFCFRGFQGDTETILDNQSIKILKNGEPVFFVDNSGVVTANNLKLYGGLIQSNDYAEALITEVYEEQGEEKQKEKIVVSSGAKIDLKNGYFYTPSFTLDRDGLTTGNVKASKLSSEYSTIEEMDIITRLKYVSKGSDTDNKVEFSTTINHPVKGTWTRSGGKVTLSGWGTSGKYYNEYMFWHNNSNNSVKIYIEFEGRGNCYLFTSTQEIKDGSYPYIYANAMSFASTQNSYKQTITVPAETILYIVFATVNNLNTDDQPKISLARILTDEFIFNVEEDGLKTNKFFLYDEDGNKYKITISGSSLVATKQ